jgi:hypothetical protein
MAWDLNDSLDKRLKLKKMDMRFGTWNIRSLYRAGSLMTVAKEISKCKLDLVGVQEVKWDGGGTEPAGQYTFFVIDPLLTNSVWNKEELLQQWKESIIVPVHKKTDCSTYRGMSLLSISYKIVSNIFLSRLSSYINEMIGDHHCGFQRKRSTIDQIFCIHQILEKNGSAMRQYINFFILFHPNTTTSKTHIHCV